jgi:hypothetical protein
MDNRDRAREILGKLPLSDAQRALYEAGLARMTDAEIAAVMCDLEEAVARAPETLKAARALIRRHNQPSRKTADPHVRDGCRSGQGARRFRGKRLSS